MKSLGFVSCFGRRVAWEDFFIHVKLKLYMNTEISGKKTMELRASLRKMFCDNSFEWTVKNCHPVLFNSFAAEFSKLFWAISWITRLLTYDIDMSVNFQFVVVKLLICFRQGHAFASDVLVKFFHSILRITRKSINMCVWDGDCRSILSPFPWIWPVPWSWPRGWPARWPPASPVAATTVSATGSVVVTGGTASAPEKKDACSDRGFYKNIRGVDKHADQVWPLSHFFLFPFFFLKNHWFAWRATTADTNLDCALHSWKCTFFTPILDFE